MKKIKIVRGTVAGGKAVDVGAVLEVSGDEARQLVALGKAEYVPAPKVVPGTVCGTYEVPPVVPETSGALVGKSRRGK